MKKRPSGLLSTTTREKPRITLYERNPARRGLDFDHHSDAKTDFARYAVELPCLNPIVDTKKSPLPPLLDLAEIVEALLTVGLKIDKEPRREIKKNHKVIRPYDSGSMNREVPTTGTLGSTPT